MPLSLFICWPWAQIIFFFFVSVNKTVKKWTSKDFPGGPVVKTSLSNAGSLGSIPCQGAKIQHASEPKTQNIKQKQYCNKFNKDFKNGPHQKKKTNFKKEKKEPQCLLAFIWWFCCYIYFNYLYPFFWEWTFINILGPLKCYFFHL